MYMEIDEDDETEDFNAVTCVRDVTFSCSNENSYKITHVSHQSGHIHDEFKFKVLFLIRVDT
jgi:hypothetical protein